MLRTKKYIIQPSANIRQIIAAIALSLLVSNAKLFSVSSPLAVCVSTLMPIRHTPVFILTSAVFSLLMPDQMYSYGAIIASLLIYAVRIILLRRNKLQSTSFLSLLCGISYFVSASALLLILRPEGSHLLKIAVFSMICGAVTYSARIKTSGEYVFDIHSMILYVFALSAVSSISIFGLNLGRSFALFALLHVAKTNDVRKTALLSVLSAAGCFATDADMLVGSAFICFAGTLISFISSRSFIRQPLYLACITIVFSVLSDVLSLDIGIVIDTFIACTVYIFTYDIVSDKADRLILKYMSEEKPVMQNQNDLILRAEAISRLKSNISGSGSEAAILELPRNSVTAYTRVCLHCTKHKACFFDKVADLSFLDRVFTMDTIKQSLPNCIRAEDILGTIRDIQSKSEYIIDRQKTIRHELSLVDSVLQGAENIINSQADNNIPDPNRSASFKRILSVNNRGVIDSRVYKDDTASVDIKTGSVVNENSLLTAIGRVTGKSYSDPQYVKCSDFTRINLYPKANYRTQAFYECHPAKKGDISGDVFTDFISGTHHYFILCDGMGTGSNAYSAASKLSSCVKDMIINGVDTEAAVSLISPVIRASGIDESFATLDLISVDLSNGKAEFIKAGAADSYILGESFDVVSTGGYPIGIFDKCYITKSEHDMSSGGEIVMCSDGADLSVRKIEKAIATSDSSDELCEKLINCRNCSQKCSDSDDVFVAVIRISRNDNLKLS